MIKRYSKEEERKRDTYTAMKGRQREMQQGRREEGR
jgi:hypothetical protein